MNNRLDELIIDVEEDSSSFWEDSSSMADPEKAEAVKPTKDKKSTEKRSNKFRSAKKNIVAKMSKMHKSKRVTKVVKASEARTVMMDAFHANMETLRTEIATIQGATKTIHKMTDNILVRGMSFHEEKQLHNQLCSLVDETNQTAQTIRSHLKLIQAETKELQENKTKVFAESDLRIRACLTSAVTRKFVDELRIYQGAQQNYKQKTKTKFKRQIQHVQPNITDEQVETLIQNGEDRDSLFQEMILADGTVNDRIRTMQANVSYKYEAILQIEQSVAMLHQMFLDMALLKEQQGVQIDQIEYHIRQANDFIETSNEDLHEANRYQELIRKKRAKIILLIAGVALVVILVLVLMP